MAGFVKVAKTSDIPPGGLKAFLVEDEFVAICHVAGGFYAFKDQCAHMDYPLSDGRLCEETITCAYHGAEFNVKTGEPLSAIGYEPVPTYRVRIDGEGIYVLVEES